MAKASKKQSQQINKVDVRELFNFAAKVLRAEFDAASPIPHALSIRNESRRNT